MFSLIITGKKEEKTFYITYFFSFLRLSDHLIDWRVTFNGVLVVEWNATHRNVIMGISWPVSSHTFLYIVKYAFRVSQTLKSTAFKQPQKKEKTQIKNHIDKKRMIHAWRQTETVIIIIRNERYKRLLSVHIQILFCVAIPMKFYD